MCLEMKLDTCCVAGIYTGDYIMVLHVCSIFLVINTSLRHGGDTSKGHCMTIKLKFIKI